MPDIFSYHLRNKNGYIYIYSFCRCFYPKLRIQISKIEKYNNHKDATKSRKCLQYKFQALFRLVQARQGETKERESKYIYIFL